ncbi:MAG: hypothetical protein Q4D21_03580 [Phascolarctobacterium sp.]|nr:hypothetical protein [Phascolarctobacterium sp.]
MSSLPEETIYVGNYKNKFIVYLDLFIKKNREPQRGEVRNLESDLYDARMDLKSKLGFADETVMNLQEKALNEYLLEHELIYIEKLRVVQFFGMMKYTKDVKDLQAILNL